MTFLLRAFEGLTGAQRESARQGPPDDLQIARPRLDSIDLLRGVIMLLMTLDHTRDFFGHSGVNPRNVAEPAVFLTRWISHFCAPLFILLAGISAYLYGSRGRSMYEVSRFLLSRGFFLILIEFTVVRFGWSFSPHLNFSVAQVIWVIGVSMMALAALIHLRSWALWAVALAMIAGHNLLDGIEVEDFGSLGELWNVLHEPGLIRLGPHFSLFILYPLIPWIGVMAAGYALGPLFRLDVARRRSWLLGLGILITLGFIILRARNFYGDPAAWGVEENGLSTALSFINCEKYPPSLLYLMMTIGPGLVLLSLFEETRGRLASYIITFGRVPFVYYVAHIYLLHGLAVALAWMTSEAHWLVRDAATDRPADYGLSLPGVYLMALVVAAMLHPLCQWWATHKQTSTDSWWSYV